MPEKRHRESTRDFRQEFRVTFSLVTAEEGRVVLGGNGDENQERYLREGGFELG